MRRVWICVDAQCWWFILILRHPWRDVKIQFLSNLLLLCFWCLQELLSHYCKRTDRGGISCTKTAAAQGKLMAGWRRWGSHLATQLLPPALVSTSARSEALPPEVQHQIDSNTCDSFCKASTNFFDDDKVSWQHWKNIGCSTWSVPDSNTEKAQKNGIYLDKTQLANFQGNSLCQATEWHLKTTVKQWKVRWKAKPLSVFVRMLAVILVWDDFFSSVSELDLPHHNT